MRQMTLGSCISMRLEWSKQLPRAETLVEAWISVRWAFLQGRVLLQLRPELSQQRHCKHDRVHVLTRESFRACHCIDHHMMQDAWMCTCVEMCSLLSCFCWSHWYQPICECEIQFNFFNKINNILSLGSVMVVVVLFYFIVYIKNDGKENEASRNEARK